MQTNDSKLWTYHQTANAENLAMGYPRQDMLHKKIASLVKAQGTILEIGFGDGYLLKRLSDKYKCFGADVSLENVEQMRKRIPSVKFELMGIDGRLPYQKDFFDAFVASEVLEHMTNSELDKAVKEIYRVLKPGGTAVITVPAKENLKENKCFCPNCGHIFHKWGHKQTWNLSKVRKIFSKFKLLNSKEFFVPYIGNSLIENAIGRTMWVARIILNKVIDVPNKNYLIILKK